MVITSYIKAIEEYLNVAQPYSGLPATSRNKYRQIKNHYKQNSSNFYVKISPLSQTFEQLHSKSSTTLTHELWK